MRGTGGNAADAQYIANKEAVGAHFALTAGLNNVSWARTVESGVTSGQRQVVYGHNNRLRRERGIADQGLFPITIGYAGITHRLQILQQIGQYTPSSRSTSRSLIRDSCSAMRYVSS